jgi:hypothetical protein
MTSLMPMNKTKYAMILLVAMASIGAYAVLSTATVAYAWDDEECDESAGPTGNPHTCDTPTGDPHEDNGNPDTGNPHNT